MDVADKSIFLIGYRGTGKTTVARHLAERLGWDWIDADDQIERRAGKPIAVIFADEGEPAFRKLEADIVAELCRHRRAVIALGGGAVLSEANRATISPAGMVIWLTAPVDTLVRRLAADESTRTRRPALTQAGGREEIEALLAVREPIYRACATFEVDTEGKTPAEIVDEIVARFQSGN